MSLAKHLSLSGPTRASSGASGRARLLNPPISSSYIHNSSPRTSSPVVVASSPLPSTSTDQFSSLRTGLHQSVQQQTLDQKQFSTRRTASQIAKMSSMPAQHGHSQPCCNIPPVVSKGYEAKGSYEELGGYLSCMCSFERTSPGPRTDSSCFQM